MSFHTVAARRRSLAALLGTATASAILLAGCSAADLFAGNEFFSESSMGVSASPRVTTSKRVPKGGGRQHLGQPYTVAGQTFVPREQPNLDVTGRASWYGPAFHGRLTANGEVFDMNHLSGAHPTLPLPSYVRVTNVDNGVSALVRINDRGPFSNSRVIDLSRRTAEVLGYINQGTANVRVQYVGPAPLNGDDTRFLVGAVNRLTPYEVERNTRMAYQEVQVAQATPAASAPAPVQRPAESAVQAAGAISGTPETLPFQLLSYGVPIAASPTLAEPYGTPIRMALGQFADADAAEDLASRFAVLGAVDTTTIVHGEQVVTHLMLTHLREGVTEADVHALAASLGISPSLL